jgi:hypothetical protein
MSAVSAWAREYVTYISSAGVMLGASGGAFMPAARYTREQAFITFLRLYSLL